MRGLTRATQPAILGWALLLSACSNLPLPGDRLSDLLRPYRTEVVQGNVITQEQLSQLRIGMSRNRTLEVLGTPLLVSMFHNQRWDYVFSIRRPGAEPLQRLVTVFFEDDQVVKINADELLTEAEFSSRIDTKLKGNIKVPNLQAEPKDLKAFLPQSTPQPAPVLMPPARTVYPPLESQ